MRETNANSKTGKMRKTGKLLGLVKICRLNADYKSHDTTKQKTNRYRYLRRKVCRPVAIPAGKSGTDSRGIGRTERNSNANALELGVQYKNSRYRQIAETCGITGNFCKNVDAPEIIFRKMPFGALPLLTVCPMGHIICPVMSGFMRFVARFCDIRAQNTSQHLPSRRDYRRGGAGSLFVNGKEARL